MTWNAVRAALPEAHAIAWDGCHKIYVAMDAEQVAEFRRLGYGSGDESRLLERANFHQWDASTDMLDRLTEWFEDSCSLRFIESVATVDGDPNEGFKRLIAQFEDEDEEVSA